MALGPPIEGQVDLTLTYLNGDEETVRLPESYGAFDHEKWDYLRLVSSNPESSYSLLDTDGVEHLIFGRNVRSAKLVRPTPAAR